MLDIQLLTENLNEQTCLDFVKSDEVGGIVVFVGTVRNQTKGMRVLRLKFEAYKPMAVSEMKKIAEEIQEKFSLLRVSIHHKVGVLDIGGIPVIIAVSAPHRKAAFAACEYAIDKLKQTVPIWKKEFFESGEMWVSATP
jgi:molybdopterin synthase catalytic subunit